MPTRRQSEAPQRRMGRMQITVATLVDTMAPANTFKHSLLLVLCACIDASAAVNNDFSTQMCDANFECCCCRRAAMMVTMHMRVESLSHQFVFPGTLCRRKLAARQVAAAPPAASSSAATAASPLATESAPASSLMSCSFLSSLSDLMSVSSVGSLLVLLSDVFN